MCIGFIEMARDNVVIGLNRDEFTKKKSESLHYWEGGGFWAGKDLDGGGTWLAINKEKKFAFLTNFRDPKRRTKNKRTRGELVTEFMRSADSTMFMSFLQKHSDDYNGFNIIFGSLDKVHHYSSVTKDFTTLSNGLHIVSNANLNTSWPKVDRLRNLLTDSSREFDAMANIMKDEVKAEDSKLPQTGLPLDQERLVSSIFIESPTYKTQSTTLINIDNKIKIKEINHLKDDIVNVCY